MSTNSDHETIEESLKRAALLERRRIIGIVLKSYGLYTLAGEKDIAAALDLLATEIEHG